MVKLRVVRTLHTGLPERLVGTTVEAARVDRGYRLTDRANKHLVVADTWIGEGRQVEEVKEPEPFDFYGGIGIP